MAAAVRRAWAGVDLGTQSARVLVLGDDGAQLALVAAPLRSTRSDGRHEQDPHEWLLVTQRLLQQATAGLPSDVRIAAVAVSGTSGTVVPLDERGRPTGAAVMYDDRRGAARLGEVQDAGAEVWQRLGYRMQATWGLPKLLAMRAHAEPGAVFGHQPDVVTAFLTGRRTPSDLSSALKTGADLDLVAWPHEVFDRLDLPVEALNGVVESGTVIGEVTADAGARTGLPVGCAVVAGSTDGCAAQFAAGALDHGAWNSVLGTTLVLKGVADVRHPDPGGAVYAHRAPFSGGWLPGGASNTGAGSVTALLPGRDLAGLTPVAAALPGIPVAYPLTGSGERFPFVSDSATAFWPAGDPPEQDAAMLQAIVFGTAFLERLAFETLQAIGYDTAGPMYLTGGGARNPWWNAVRARVSGRPALLPTQTEGAAGMALLAAAALEERTDGQDPLRTAAARLLGPAAAVEPADLPDRELEDAYGRFLDRTAEWRAGS